MRFKLREGTQRTYLRVILSLNLIVPVNEMSAVEPVDKLTFGINDDKVCGKNCESDAMLSVASLSKIHDFVKAKLEEILWANRSAELTNVSLLQLLLSV